MPVDQQALASTLQMLLRTVDLAPDAGEDLLMEHLGQVVEAAREVLGVDGVGLLLLDEHDRLRLVGASDPGSAALERGQQELGAGPAVDCVRSASVVAVPDLAADRRYDRLWRWLTDPARSPDGVAPARAVLSAPVLVRAEVTGTLNVLRREPERWTGDQEDAIEAYANVIGVLLRLGLRSRPGRG